MPIAVSGSAFGARRWGQSAQLNAEREDHPLCGGALGRQGGRGATSCQYAQFMLRWLGHAPEDFLTGPGTHTGDVRLPERDLTWAQLADELG